MRGRLWVHTICLLGEGILVFVFVNTNTLAGAICTLVFFSIFVQACEGAAYGIVPYVDVQRTGTISGIVGAGGNMGAVMFGFCFRELSYYHAFMAMGSVICGVAFLSPFICIDGQAHMLRGKLKKYKKASVDDNSSIPGSVSTSKV
jgi:NNP family nitrate/nitrite transporter-like MFS transporter